MCFGVPGRVVAVEAGEPRSGVVDFDGTTRPVCLAYAPGAGVGDCVIVHVGFAIGVVDEAVEAVDVPGSA
ncbi:HypC/HybG/HupF family hydrogenase formation chaperone [Saccharothrix syringae]|uniref:HypC/HybG/HupF family hydrogenase formation chaperone n=1 Tax=Saccharothrix syringae TaxID=103733 RepID=A0A5Q0H279_SACSY|nr:HypC/HybG/HupF family hydrogenase formation chaperone [Saccharothrix syringae]QFZ20239.1 HypC/HybG/HupF family hydrogenase formation chaperone [Saccharothrix syringae]